MPRSKEYKEREKQRKKEEYDYYKSKGICVCCHQDDAVPGKTRCAYCADIHNEYSTNYLHRTNYHAEHAEERHEKRKAQREARKTAGLCVRCGKRKAKDGYNSCSWCLARERLNSENARRRNGVESRDLWAYTDKCWKCGKPRYKGFHLCKGCYEKLLATQKLATVASQVSGNNRYCNGTIKRQIEGWWREWRKN